jgi:predicted AlkP superfamily pyrophosphatase or phosphodiesterase
VRLRCAIVGLALGLAAVSGCKNSSKQRAAGDETPAAAIDAAAPRPRLVVLIVVDQLPSWSFDRDAELTRGGIRRLLDRGVFYRRARYPFASTYTAAGHAALATGAPPAVTGILANKWYGPDRSKKIYSTRDPDAPLLAIPGLAAPADGAGASPRQLLVDGVADVLIRETGGAGKAVSVGLKARAALFALGRKPTLAVWYQPSLPGMTTSRWFADEPPAWLVALAADHPVKALFDEVWTPRDPALLARATGLADDAPGEGGAYGLGATFPHALADSDNPGKAFRSTPAGTDYTIDAALAAVDGEKLGADQVPDILAVCLSPHDYAGHDWGQESWERLDLFLRMDDSIGRLLDGLDQRVGADRYAVVLTSDHGVTRMVEQSRAVGKDARRVRIEELAAIAERAASSVLGKGDWVAAMTVPTVYMSNAFAEQPAERRSAALDAVAAAIDALPHVDYAGRSDALTGNCEDRDGVEAMACRSLHPNRSGEIFVAAGPDCLCTSAEYTTGTSHGSANPDDTDVPVIVAGPGIAPRVVDELVSALQVAPTLAKLLGVPPPAAATALPLP